MSSQFHIFHRESEATRGPRSLICSSCSCLLFGLDLHDRVRVVVGQPIDKVEDQEEYGEENEEKAVNAGVAYALPLFGSQPSQIRRGRSSWRQSGWFKA